MNNSGSNNLGSKFNLPRFVIITLLFLFVVYIITLSIKYFSEMCYVKRNYGEYLISLDPSKVCLVKEPPSIQQFERRNKMDDKEVFHISDQIYSFEEACDKCKEFGASIATKDQLINAYNNGADWCSYGWSAGQSAYYPTQKCTYERLQKSRDKNRCGKPGLNGGHFDNPDLKFGVNCYGIKPMGQVAKIKHRPCPPKCGSVSMELAPFNPDQWSKYDKPIE